MQFPARRGKTMEDSGFSNGRPKTVGVRPLWSFAVIHSETPGGRLSMLDRPLIRLPTSLLSRNWALLLIDQRLAENSDASGWNPVLLIGKDP